MMRRRAAQGIGFVFRFGLILCCSRVGADPCSSDMDFFSQWDLFKYCCVVEAQRRFCSLGCALIFHLFCAAGAYKTELSPPLKGPAKPASLLQQREQVNNLTLIL